MLFNRLSAIIYVVLASTHMSIAAVVTRSITCDSGDVTANAACCPLFTIVTQIQQDLIDGGECGEEAHSALRLAFHDDIGFSMNGGKGGGADGSILVFNSTELTYHDITAAQFPVFQETGLSAGDFVHLAAAIGTANCPGAPQLDFFFGRPDPTAAAPDLTVPEPTGTYNVTAILDRFADAGFAAAEVVALLSSHTVAAADDIDTTIPGTPFDTTVGTLNGSQAGEVLSPIAGEMRLQSDFVISRDSRTACLWQDMINNQNTMMAQFKTAMSKMQLLGQNSSLLTDCSDVIPTPATFTGPITYPASFSEADVQIACTESPFPSLATVAGAAPTVSPVSS